MARKTPALSRGGDPAASARVPAPAAPPRRGSGHGPRGAGPAAPAGGLQVHLFGDPHLVLPDGRTLGLERRAAALCALAALEPGVSRERVARWLWPDSDDPRRNLRQQLLRFRHQFGQALVVGETTLALAEGIGLVPAAAGAVLLASHDDSDDDADAGDGFASWLRLRRAAGRDAQRAELQGALSLALVQNDLDAALAAARTLVLTEPDSEEQHRALMHVQYLRGDVGQATQTYEALRERLARSAQATPSPATEQLARTLRQAQGPAGVAAHDSLAAPELPARRVALPASVLRPPRMVGRAHERQAAQQAMQAGRAVLVLGEAGMGKSRLLAELGAAGTVAVQGRPGDAGVPYATLARLLRRLLEQRQLQLPENDRAVMSRLLPELGRAPATPAEDQRLAMRQAVEAMLAQAAAADVRTVAVDDLHFADDASIEMLQALAATPSGAAGPGFVFAQRPGESRAAHQALRQSLAEVQRLAVIELAPLDEAGMAELLATLGLPGVDAQALAMPLVRHTGGNPLFALETLKLGLADGSLAAGTLPRPQAVGELIELRLRQLGPRALSLARVAAVAGVDFDIELAEHAMGVRAVDLADAWAELEQAQVLRDDAFAHDLVCDAVLGGVPAVVARHLHGATAAWLAQRGAEPARIAMHWLEAAQPQRALAPLIEAAARANTSVRPAEELALYEQARRIHESAGSRAEEAGVLFKMSECLRLLDDAPQMQRVLDRLLAIAADDGDRARAWLASSRVANETRRMDDAVAHAREALPRAQAHGEPETLGRCRIQLALVLAETMQAEEAHAQLMAARDWALRAEAARRTEYLHVCGLVAMHREDYPGAVDAFERLLAEPALQADPGHRLQVQGNLAVAHAGMGAMRAALAADEQRRALAAAHEVSGPSQIYLELNAATLLMAVGRYREALDFLERAQAREVPDQAMLHLRWATLMFHLGQHARALQHLERCQAAPTVHPIIKLTAEILGVQVRAAAQGRGQIGEDLLARVRALAEQDRRNAAWVRHDLACSEFAPPAQGLEHATRAAERAGRAHLHGLRVAALTLRIEHRLALGEPAAALADVSLVMTLRETYESHAMYRCRVAWAAVRVHQALGQPEASGVLQRELAWIAQAARDHVPASFRESFLERNPVNRALRAAASRAQLGAP
jgi:DNA-binding SARP family transcriptional activator/tetratricopeptide (TPR) repeat protein